jgi:glycosyltransferase involved in cell wall biosynthesis
MRILLISSSNFYSTYGGGQVYVKNMVDEMLRQGMDITIVSRDNNSIDAVRKEMYKGAPVYVINSNADRKNIVNIIKEEIRPDIIHAHGEKALFCSIGDELGIPVVVTAHHGGIVCPAGTLMNCKDEICEIPVNHSTCLKCCLRNVRSGLFYYPLMRLLPRRIYLKMGEILRKLPFIPFVTPIGCCALSIEQKRGDWDVITQKCAVMIAPCLAIAQAMMRNGLSEDKVKIIPHGIPLPESVPPFPSYEKGIKFFYVGRICYVKGLHILLSAFNQVSAENIELHLIGGWGNKQEKRYMDKLQKKYRKDKRIVWHGKIPSGEIFGTIASFHTTTTTTTYLEAFGLNIAEALAMGKPVIATRCGGAEMQVDDSNGWLVEPNNVEELRELFLKIIENPQLIKAKAAHASEKVISIRRHVGDLAEMYKSLLLA